LGSYSGGDAGGFFSCDMSPEPSSLEDPPSPFEEPLSSPLFPEFELAELRLDDEEADELVGEDEEKPEELEALEVECALWRL